MTDFLPKADLELDHWSSCYSSRISSSPSTYSISNEMAESLAQKQSTYAQALQLAQQSSTRTTPVIELKNARKAELVEMIRMTARIIRAAPNISNAQLVDLGMPPRSKPVNRIARPTAIPGISLCAVNDRTIRVRLFDPASPDRRSKPAGIASAAIFYHLGDAPPEDVNQYRFHGTESRMSIDLTVHGKVDWAQKVWVIACWQNPRNERGLFCDPKPVRIMGGLDITESMKLAA